MTMKTAGKRLALAHIAASQAPLAHADPGSWGYRGDKGPEHWARLSPNFAGCQQGKAQSPIELASARPGREEPLVFHYRSNALTLVNQGRTVRMDFEPDCYIRVGPRRYELLQADFHAPGEHGIHGVAADMAAQFLHQDLEDKLALVEVPIVAGRRMNNVLARDWENLPERPDNRFQGRQVGINPTFLTAQRPHLLQLLRLPQPSPLYRGVQGFVFQQHLEVEAGLIRRLLDLFGPNSRPLQPLNGRPISLQPH